MHKFHTDTAHTVRIRSLELNMYNSSSELRDAFGPDDIASLLLENY